LIEGLSKSPRHSSQTLQQQFGSTNEAIIAPIRLASSGNVVAYRERRLLGRPRPLEVWISRCLVWLEHPFQSVCQRQSSVWTCVSQQQIFCHQRNASSLPVWSWSYLGWR